MSEPHRWRRPAQWTLRTRVLAALVALLAAVSVVIGVVSVLSMNSFLLDRLDDQLALAGGRAQPGPGDDTRSGERGGDGGDRPPPPSLSKPGQAEGTLNAHVQNGVVDQSGVLDAAGNTHTLSAAQDAILAALPVGGEPRTVDLAGGLGRYRLRADRAPDGDVIIAGLPLGGLRATVYRLAAVIAVVAAAGLWPPTPVRTPRWARSGRR